MTSRRPGAPITFGDSQLCTTGPRVVLDAVDHHVSGRPRDVTTQVWRVTAADDAANQGMSTVEALDGTAEDVTATLSGRLQAVEGTAVTKSCKDKRNGFTDLLTTVRSSPAGSKIDGMTIRYHVGDRHYAVRTHWTYVLCGPAVDTEDCDSGH
jgi:hypothetical protein